MGLVGLQPIGYFVLVVSLLAIQCQGKGDFEDFEHPETSISPERIAQFYTETLVQSASKEEQRCSENVFKARKEATANGKLPSLGVQPTVGLGAALLIFLGVGLFAVGIAQGFQMVSMIDILRIFIMRLFSLEIIWTLELCPWRHYS